MNTELVKRIQTKVGVAADGLLGPKTLSAIAKALGLETETKAEGAAPELVSLLLSLAEKEIGTREEGTNTGKRVREYQAATNLEGTGWPWCSAFLVWLFREAGKQVSLPFKRPVTAAAFGWEEWARKEGQKLIERPASVKRGDVVIFSFSHIGICSKDSDENGTFESIEGNTNAAGEREGGAVMKKRRKISLVRSVVRLS